MGNCLPIAIQFKNEIQKKWFDCVPPVPNQYIEEITTVITTPTIPNNVYHNCTYENTPTYSYENLHKIVKVLRVVDGDTVDIALHYEETGKIFQHRVRLYGIDTPEKRPALSNENRDKEIAASKKSSEALTQKMKENDNLVVAHFYKPDKYGRLLCTFYDKQGDDINKWMVQSGFAYEYFGKTKKKFSQISEKSTVEKTLDVSDNAYFETHDHKESDSSDDFENITEVPE